NVGKSTLLNSLLHEEKAIVSDIHGTTRDVIEDTTIINGIAFRFIDTAGFRNTQDRIEQLGIERAYQKLNEATIILWVIDTLPTQEEVENIISTTADKKLIVVHNKIDVTSQKISSEDRLIKETVQGIQEAYISAKYQQGIKELEEKIFAAANIPEITENSVIVTSARHYEALIRSDQSILRVIAAMNEDLSGDLISEDLHICLEQLSEITGGQITPNEVLGNIFQHFCIGK
nr:GTP-binding protein [Bacteroidaceae bacterium]